MRRSPLRRIAIPLAAMASVVVAVPAYAGTQDAYGANDGGGFRNVLPPGSRGLDNLGNYLAFKANGTLPDHWADQQPLYENLLYASPALTDAQIPSYFKDATFGVKKGDVESVTKPRKGVKIIRDKGFGVPHIYGKTRSDTMFGAGYAGANDRLFLMDVLRHTGRADLSSFLGGSNLNTDASQWQFAAYTNADLKEQLKKPARVSKKAWKKLRNDVKNYVAGVNAYIAAAKKNSALMPTEYSALKKTVQPWKATDVVATASLVGGIFGRGGGSEVQSGLIYRALEAKFGAAEAKQIWTGFRDKNDPSAPTTIPGSFPYMTTDSFATPGLAIPDAGSVTAPKVISGNSATKTLAADDSLAAGSVGE